MFATSAVARPQPYGEHFLRLDRVSGAAGGAVVSRVDSPEDYLAQMESMETEQGPYADGLAEPLGSLGRYYRQQGDFEQAQEAYRRALHIIRVNDGLYSERQIPLVRDLLATFRDAGDYEALDRRYEYLFRLYGAGRAPYTELRMRAALEYLRWQREAMRMKLDGGGADRLLDAMEINDEILDGIEHAGSVPYAWRKRFVLSQLRNLYILRDRFQPDTHENPLGSSRNVFGAQPITVELRDQRLENLRQGAEVKARTLAEKLRQAAVAEGPVAEARLELALADWYFWNGKRGSAKTGYRRVAELLRNAGEPGLVGEWLGQPVELPEDGAFWAGRPSADAALAEVRASFNVSSRGRVSDIEVKALNPGAEADLSRFKRNLNATLFRPRWDGGEAESVEGLVRDYRLLR